MSCVESRGTNHAESGRKLVAAWPRCADRASFPIIQRPPGRFRVDAIFIKRLRRGDVSWFVPAGARRTTAETKAFTLSRVKFDAAVSPGRRQKYRVALRWFDGVRAVEQPISVTRAKRTWSVTGQRIMSDRFNGVDAGDFAIIIARKGAAGLGSEWTWTVDVACASDDAVSALHKELTARVPVEAAHRLDDPAIGSLLKEIREALPAFSGGEVTVLADMSNADRAELAQWLVDRLKLADLESLASSTTSLESLDVLHELGIEAGTPDKRALAEMVVDGFGTELLADKGRRDLLSRRAFPSTRKHYPKLGRWSAGKGAARDFVRTLGLPSVMAGTVYAPEPTAEDVEAFKPLGNLHTYQTELSQQIVRTLTSPEWKQRRAVVWLPTGTGKTRVMVETLLMNTRLEAPRNCILWIANRGELCEQAIEEFRHVWMVRGFETPSAAEGGAPTLRFVRLWGGREWQDPPLFPTVIVASIQTLARRLDADDDVYSELLALMGRRCAAIVLDEAHHAVAPSYARVASALGISRARNYYGDNQSTAPPLFGLTATPARSSADETEKLARRFNGQLLEPGKKFQDFAAFIRGGFLSHPRHVVVETGATLTLKSAEEDEWKRFGRIPSAALSRLGRSERRTAAIVKDLYPRLKDLRSVLVFACSVRHAKTIAEVLSQMGVSAAALHGGTPRPVRWQTIRQFRQRRIQVLVSCDLLTTGFDAPNVDAVVLARPVESRVLYAQMVGRGLRGPENGGTPECLILDYEDAAGPYGDLDALRKEFRRDFLGGVR